MSKHTPEEGTGRTQTQTWDVWAYVVSADDAGYKISARNRRDTVTLEAPIARYHAGTPQQYDGAYPTDEQIRDALDLADGTPIVTNGDEMTIFADAQADAYPFGELNRVGGTPILRGDAP